MAVIGIDLGGTKLSCAIFHTGGEIIHKITHPLEKRQGDEVFELIRDVLSEQLDFAFTKEMTLDSIGCCVPGIVRHGTGRIWAPNIPGWDDYPLLENISESLPYNTLKVILDNDRACCILGEVWQGNAKGSKNAIFLAVGTGIGAGIMADGRILRGFSDIAGAIGWLALDPPYKEKYTDCGCFEYHASGEGIAKVASDFLRNEPTYGGILRKKGSSGITTHDIFEAYDQNDPLAVAVLKNAVVYWGMTVANLVSLFNPEKIIMGGGVFGPAVMFLEDILSEAGKWAQPLSIRQVQLQPSALGGDAGLFGAGFMALSKTDDFNPNDAYV